MKSLPEILLLLFVLTQGLLCLADSKNNVILVTDLLDDDIRGVVGAVLHPNLRDRLKAIIITTGNVQLKSAIARQIVWGLGAKIPVWAGTQTNLSQNSVTQFAGEWELEGESLLTTRQMETLHPLHNQSGNAANRLLRLMEEEHSLKRKIDVIGITALTDIVKAIHLNPKLAKDTLGTLFAMGFHKKNANGIFVPPYNIHADPDYGVETYRLYQEGFFDNFIHVPSDTAMLRSGLPNGYLPATPEGAKILAEIEAAMKKYEVLRRILLHAAEYGGNWRHAGMKQFGYASDWLAGTFKGVDQNANFYISDLSAIWLAAQTPEALSKILMEENRLELTGGNSPLYRPTGKRAIRDVTEFPGMAVMEEYSRLLHTAGKYSPLTGFLDSSEVAVNDSTATNHAKIESAAHLNNRSLVLNFKNSPDDWFALVRLLSVPEARLALERGGIIVEGFKTEQVANAVRAVLKDLGEVQVPVAEGKQYRDGEVSHITNFNGEEALYTIGPGLKAFEALTPAPDTFKLNPKSIIQRAGEWARDNGGNVDAIILGEGGDVYKAVLQSPEISKYYKQFFIMAGVKDGNNDGEYDLTRNFLRESKKRIVQLRKLKQGGAEIFAHSSYHFGGSLTSDEAGASGNGKMALTALQEAGKKLLSMQCIDKFWNDWSSTFDWKFNLEKKGVAYDANHKVDINTISPLGLYVTDSYLRGDKLFQDESITFEPNTIDISAPKKIKRTKVATAALADITWMTRESTKDIRKQARALTQGIRHFLRSATANEHFDAAKEHGFPSTQAQASLESLKQEQNGSRNKACGVLTRIGNTPNPG